MAKKLATLAKLIEIIKLVIEMRKAQKAYFKLRLSGDLQRSKQLERIVDAMLDDIVFPPEKEEPEQKEFGTGGWMST